MSGGLLRNGSTAVELRHSSGRHSASSASQSQPGSAGNKSFRGNSGEQFFRRRLCFLGLARPSCGFLKARERDGNRCPTERQRDGATEHAEPAGEQSGQPCSGSGIQDCGRRRSRTARCTARGASAGCSNRAGCTCGVFSPGGSGFSSRGSCPQHSKCSPRTDCTGNAIVSRRAGCAGCASRTRSFVRRSAARGSGL